MPLWAALTDFQAAKLGPVSLVASLKPSSVASFVARLDPERWSAQAHAGSGIVRAHAVGDWQLDEAGRPDRAASAAWPIRRRRQRDPESLPDRLEGPPARLGRAAQRLGARRAGQGGARPAWSDEPGPVYRSNLSNRGRCARRERLASSWHKRRRNTTRSHAGTSPGRPRRGSTSTGCPARSPTSVTRSASTAASARRAARPISRPATKTTVRAAGST